MKLRNLNGAIRKIEGPVLVKLTTGDGVLEIGLVKSTLIENLKALYGDDNTVETSLTINGNRLAHEDGTPFGDPISRSSEDDQPVDLGADLLGADDDDDLLGGDAVSQVSTDDDNDDLDLLG